MVNYSDVYQNGIKVVRGVRDAIPERFGCLHLVVYEC